MEQRHSAPYIPLGVFALLVVISCYFAFILDRKHTLKVYYLQIGQGDAALIESPTGRQVLIDGGPPGNILSELREVMPFYDRSIDVVIATHPDQDHVGGLRDVLAHYSVGLFIESGAPSKTKTYTALLQAVRDKKIPDVVASRGMKLFLGGDVLLSILFPDYDVSAVKDTNEASIVAKLLYGATSYLFTGDSPIKIENRLLTINATTAELRLKSDVLKLGHHGSRTSSSEAYLEAVAPTRAIISVGKANRYGHPHEEVMERLQALGIPWYRTDEDGRIELRSNGLVFARY